MSKEGKKYYTKATNKAVQRYNIKNYERLEIRVKMGEKQAIIKQAESLCMSLNAYINKLIKIDMEK